MKASTSRFTDRAENYDKYRPNYPAGIIQYLKQTIGLKQDFQIADIGSGTGIFTELLLNNGYQVNAVEPNADMRIEAEKRLQRFPGFHSINGSAENTSLPDQSINLITAAQAFHWFSLDEVKKEFVRILKPPGYVLLAWNIQKDSSPFMADYKAIKEKFAEGLQHTHRANLDAIKAFFAPGEVTTHEFPHEQLLTQEQLAGYLLSFSTIPLQNDPRFKDMMSELDDLFKRVQENGLVKMEYETKLYLGKLISI